MTDLQDPSTIIVDDTPIATRRQRRSVSTAFNTYSRTDSNPRSRLSPSHGISTPPATPKRAKKRVRFSDPGPATQTDSGSSGLTPFIRRTSLTTPTSKRRHSTPATLWNRADYDAPLSGTLQFAPLRQVLDGRVKRRIRRNRLSEEVNTIEWDKKTEAKAWRSEVARLKAELAAKDLEVQSMRDEHEIASQIEGESGLSLNTATTLNSKVQELERQVQDLKAGLQRKEAGEIPQPDWTLSARDPFNFNDHDDDTITDYGNDFYNNMTDDEMITTPTRLNTSFPSPPSTMPNTPCQSAYSINAGIQTVPVPDAEKEALQSQLESLQSELSRLASSIALKDDHQTRLTEKLSEFIPMDESHDHTTLDSALDTVLTQLALSQSHVLERTNAFSALTSEISHLGFPNSGPEETIETIANQFRRARLDLEYLTPGEVVEGFENDKLLDMLISRLRTLVENTKERDDSIDQYHEQEVLLRQQLNGRVDAMDSMRKDLFHASGVVNDLREEIKEKETSNERLQNALNGYRDEVKSLEGLIERLEREGGTCEAQLRSEIKEAQDRLQDEVLKHDCARADNEGKEIIITELERRLGAALQAAADVEQQLALLLTSHVAELAEKDAVIDQMKLSSLDREQNHGSALALRDTRVSEMREEIVRVNTALKSAHSTILSLRAANQDLQAQVEGEKTRGQFIIQSMLEQSKLLQETAMGYMNGDVSVQAPAAQVGSSPLVGGLITPQSGSRRGRFMDGDLARRGSKKRRYDSGLGFLEEESEGEMME